MSLTNLLATLRGVSLRNG